MNVSKEELISASDIDCGDKIIIRQPSLGEIRKKDGVGIGFRKYHEFMDIMAMTDEDVKAMMPEDFPKDVLEQLTVFTSFLIFKEFRERFAEAIEFYTGAPVQYLEHFGIFQLWDGGFITSENFTKIRNVILTINGLSVTEEDDSDIQGAKAKAIFEKINAGRKKKAKLKAKGGGDRNKTISNLLSSISAKSPSYNLINIWNLTVWQLYNQFGRVSVNNQLDVYALRWAAYGKDQFDFTTWYKADESEKNTL